VKRIILFLLITPFFSHVLNAVEPPSGFDYETIRRIPILEGGRYKPLGTFAGESMKTITGRWKFEKQDPTGVLLSMMTSEDWFQEEMIRVDYHPLKEALGLDIKKKHFSYAVLASNEHLRGWIDRVSQKHATRLELNKIENEFSKLYNQLSLFQVIQNGDALTLVPPPGNDKDVAWVTINHPHGYPEEKQKPIQNTFLTLLNAIKNRDASAFKVASSELANQLANLNPALYPSLVDMDREVTYNQVRPFLKSWIFYLIAFLLFLVSFYVSSRLWYWTSFGFALAGFAYHSYGLLMRGMVSHRAPVSNMYESVIFVGWGIIAIAIAYELLYRDRWFAAVASGLGVLTLILADILPFDSNIEPLVPVLRSNYWLIVHVLTITLSYSAFALAMGLAHINLWVYFYKPNHKDLLKKMSLFIYRVLQIGVVFLAAGTILGGVWAAESWGRFWGWDPKETWSLISLLGYLAILHARYTGWIRNFGTAVCSVLGFWLILMTWYGVNFVLGSALHGYGSGSGGVIYVVAFLVAEILFLVGVAWKYKLLSVPATVSANPTDNA